MRNTSQHWLNVKALCRLQEATKKSADCHVSRGTYVLADLHAALTTFWKCAGAEGKVQPCGRPRKVRCGFSKRVDVVAYPHAAFPTLWNYNGAELCRRRGKGIALHLQAVLKSGQNHCMIEHTQSVSGFDPRRRRLNNPHLANLVNPGSATP